MAPINSVQSVIDIDCEDIDGAHYQCGHSINFSVYWTAVLPKRS